MHTIGAICPHCNQPSASYAHGSLALPAEFEGDIRRPFTERYSLVNCEICSEPFLIVQAEVNESWDGALVVWPSNHRSLSPAIPARLREELEEARTCYSVKAYRAAAVMVRRVLEAFCHDQGVHERNLNLHSQLRKLVDQRTIDERLLEWAQGLRILGNVGAHYSEHQITAQDATDAIELAEAVLDYVYVFAAKYHAFKARLDAQKARIAAATP